MAGRNGGRFPEVVLNPAEVQALRTKLVEGHGLTVPEILRIISSHEHIRAHALVWRSKIGILTQENEDLMLALRRAGVPKERTTT